ncbi:MAG: apolipoprotein N-acyltransferase [Treponema sp.]
MYMLVCSVSAICSAVLLSLGIPNEFFYNGSVFFGVVAFIPLYTGLYMSKSRKMTAFMYGMMVSCVHLCSSFWLVHFQDFAIFTLGASTVAYFFLGLPFGSVLFSIKRLPVQLRAFAFAGIIVLWEWFKSSGFLAYPWGSTAMTALSWRTLIQIADITGVWGVTFVLAAVSALLAEVLRAICGISGENLRDTHNSLRKTLVFSASLLVLMQFYGLYRLYEPRVPEKTLNLTMIQQNTDPWISDQFAQNLADIQTLTETMVMQAEQPSDLIVWSETSLIYGYDEYQSLYALIPETESFTDFLKRLDTPLLTGSPRLIDAEKNSYSNSVYLIQPDGSIADTYGKIQLVCFAEYIPFIDHPWVQKLFDRLVGFSSGWTPGTEYKVLTLHTKSGEQVSFAAPICFEDAFPALCAHLHNQGSELLLNLTNDSWSKTASAEYQHFAVAAFRAIELRTTLVRATNAGYSVVVDPTGTVLADMPLFTATGMNAAVPVYAHQQTCYARWKDWFPALILLVWLMGAFRYRLHRGFRSSIIVYRSDALQHITAAALRRHRAAQCRMRNKIRRKKHGTCTVIRGMYVHQYCRQKNTAKTLSGR